MLTGRPPFKIDIDKLDSYSNNSKIWKILARDLISRILVPNPEDRLNLDQILSHQWFIDTPSLRPFLNKNFMNSSERKRLDIRLFSFNSENKNKKYDSEKKQIFIKLIKNDENSFKQNNKNIDKNVVKHENGFYFFS